MDPILDQYETTLPLLRRFSGHAVSLLTSILDASNIQLHSITSRIKSRASLAEKIVRKSHSYKSLSDVTDIVGLRVISYLPEEVDLVAKVIEEEFKVDKLNSVDKRQLLAPDRFGYLSVHYVAQMRDDRATLLEYREYKEFKMEIQVRSILQHAWAEIQHDLGYKAKGEVPSQMSRRFYRIAGLLEIADDEFSRLKIELEGYQSDVRRNMGKKGADIELNLESLLAFISSSSVVAEIDTAISAATHIPLDSVKDRGGEVPALKILGVSTIAELERELRKNRDVVVRQAVALCVKELQGGSFSRGVSIFYLCYALATQSEELEASSEMLTRIDRSPSLTSKLLEARKAS